MIVTDQRNDWPTQGAAQALMQICRMALNSHQILNYILSIQLRESLESILAAPTFRHEEAIENLNVSIAYIRRGSMQKIELKCFLGNAKFVEAA